MRPALQRHAAPAERSGASRASIPLRRRRRCGLPRAVLGAAGACRARRAWLRSARLAAELRMPFDEAGARLDLARATGDVAQEARAVAQLTALGCVPATAQREGFA